MRQNRLLSVVGPVCLWLLMIWCSPALSQAVIELNSNPVSGAESGIALTAISTSIPEISTSGAEAWLVTFGPGQAYWERFGHNAIWLREPAAGLDHTFNFGFFDFEQEDFFLRFLRGKMMYFSVAQPASREFDFYQQDNRSVRLQKLNLSGVEYQRLRDYLLTEIKPENRNYHYDYYLNNCSTRIRDAIDLALGGELASATRSTPSELNFRDQTRRLTQSEYWYYLGLEIGLGRPVDRPISQWENMFIPMVVADELASLNRPAGPAGAGAGAGQAVVSQEVQLYTSTLTAAPSSPTSVWLRYLLIGLLLAGLYWLCAKFVSQRLVRLLNTGWALLLGTCGLGLGFLWLFTDHSVTVNNVNLLLFNPLLVVALAAPMHRLCALLLVAGVVLSTVLLMFTHSQYNADVLALVAPISLSVAAYWFFSRRRISKEADLLT